MNFGLIGRACGSVDMHRGTRVLCVSVLKGKGKEKMGD